MAPAMPWLTDPQLYLHSQGGGVVHVWKCKKQSSVLVPMKSTDFDDLGKVFDHLDLVQHLIKWDETKYKALVKYISERRFLVNIQGFVILEIYKFGEDGEMDTNADPIYIRSLDILRLDTYVNCFNERDLPFRTVQYLEEDPAAVAPKVKLDPRCYVQTFRIHGKEDTGFSLSIREGRVILAANYEADLTQHWVKYDKYDNDGLRGFVLVNKFTGQALMHPPEVKQLVQLANYEPSVLDESTIWTERVQDDGYSHITKVNDSNFVIDAYYTEESRGPTYEIRDGTIVGIWTDHKITNPSSKIQNQKWKFIPLK